MPFGAHSSRIRVSSPQCARALPSARSGCKGALVLCESIQPLGGQLSLRDLVEMMAERGQPLAHTTTMRSLQRYVPESVKRWSN